MNIERLMMIILAPVVSEKSTLVADKHRQYVFKVVPSATKLEIRQAIELLFKVNVKAVTTTNVQGKIKIFRQKPGQRTSWKKAYVKLAPGQEINFSSAE